MYSVYQRMIQTTPTRILASAQQFNDYFAYETPDQTTQLFGLGVFKKLQPKTKTSAFTEVKVWYQQLKVHIPDAFQTQLRIMGAFAFEKQRTTQKDIWGNLQNGYFFLPKFTLIKRQNDEFNVFIVGNNADKIQADLADFLRKFIEIQPIKPDFYKMQQQIYLAEDHWQTAVAQVVTKETAGKLQKVVLARQLQTTSAYKLDPGVIWLNLTQKSPHTYHILLKHGTRAFISGTPERLLNLAHNHLQAAAVAGTIQRGKTPKIDKSLGRQLLQDPKNRQEQQYVVDTIVSTLQKNHVKVSYSKQPILLKSETVQHLYTPIKGELPIGLDIFQLLQALHPTPALGGVPRTAATEVIYQSEALARGLFGAPIGYLDFSGHGEFDVGIRSALLQQNTATLFAGAGIVANSIPKKEVQETAFKFQPMLEAIYGSEQK